MLKRTNIYLEDEQISKFKALGQARGQSSAAVVRDALNEWLDERSVRVVGDEERKQRLEKLFARRQNIADRLDLDPDKVEKLVAGEVTAYRREQKAARRR